MQGPLYPACLLAIPPPRCHHHHHHPSHARPALLFLPQVGFFHSFKDGVDYVFVDHSCYHNRGKDIYAGERQENMFRCALLCKAALEAVWHVPCGGIVYGDQSLCFIANDWHTALLPVYLQVRALEGGRPAADAAAWCGLFCAWCLEGSRCCWLLLLQGGTD